MSSAAQAGSELSDGISVAPPKLSLDCEDSRSNGVTTSLVVSSNLLCNCLWIRAISIMNAQDIANNDLDAGPVEVGYTELPFPPVTKQHILNCSYHHWHPKSVLSRAIQHFQH